MQGLHHELKAVLSPRKRRLGAPYAAGKYLQAAPFSKASVTTCCCRRESRHSGTEHVVHTEPIRIPETRTLRKHTVYTCEKGGISVLLTTPAKHRTAQHYTTVTTLRTTPTESSSCSKSCVFFSSLNAVGLEVPTTLKIRHAKYNTDAGREACRHGRHNKVWGVDVGKTSENTANTTNDREKFLVKMIVQLYCTAVLVQRWHAYEKNENKPGSCAPTPAPGQMSFRLFVLSESPASPWAEQYRGWKDAKRVCSY